MNGLNNDAWTEIERLAGLYDRRKGAVNFEEISKAFMLVEEKRKKTNEPLGEAFEKLKRAKAEYDFYFSPEAIDAKEKYEIALHEYQAAEMIYNKK